MAKKYKVLVVEDSPTMNKMLRTMLSRIGYNIFAAENGEEGIQKFEENKPDLVLLDLILPDMNGVEVLRKIKEIESTAMVIIVSANADIRLAIEAMKYGAYDYIMKPFNNVELLKMVKDALLAPRIRKKKKSNKKGSTAEGGSSKALPIAIGSSVLVLVLLLVLIFLKPKLGVKEKDTFAYQIPYSHPAAITQEKEGHLWIADGYGQSIYHHRIEETSLVLVKEYSIPGTELSGLTFIRAYLWSCDSGKGEFLVHSTEGDLSVIKKYKSPGPSPSAIYFDGENLWSTDTEKSEIYKHEMDEKLTIIGTYDSPGPNPVGIFSDGRYIFSADADTGKIYKHEPDEAFSIVHTYKPDVSPFRISGITYDGKFVWISLENEPEIRKYSLKKL